MRNICEIWRKKQMYFGIAIQAFIRSLIGWRCTQTFVLLDSMRLSVKSITPDPSVQTCIEIRVLTYKWKKHDHCLVETMSHLILTCSLRCCKCNLHIITSILGKLKSFSGDIFSCVLVYMFQQRFSSFRKKTQNFKN